MGPIVERSHDDTSRSGREFVPRGVGVEKPARGGAPTISSERTPAILPHLGEVFHPRSAVLHPKLWITYAPWLRPTPPLLRALLREPRRRGETRSRTGSCGW